MPDAQSRSTPYRPAVVEKAARAAARKGYELESQVVIPNVPAYEWHHGCGPTAIGMILGYWDGNGFDDLFPGAATSQTAAVNARIASTNHYRDYSLPLDPWPGPIRPDASETNPAGCHPHDSIADWMRTSWSIESNYYGWSWFSHADDAVLGYVPYASSRYQVAATNRTWAALPWASYCGQIDAGRPVLFLVDYDGDGLSDHFVTALGYGTQGGTQYYACYDTYDGDLHWYEFAPMASSRVAGIYGAVFVALSQDPPLKPVNPWPSNGAENVSINVTLAWEDGGGAWGYEVYFGTNATLGTNDRLGVTSETAWKPGVLRTRTLYYWRVDATNCSGTTTGDVWSFTTADVVIHYVATNGGNVSPYTNWATASRTIVDAVRVAANGDWVLVSNGIYRETYTVAVTGILVQVASVNGPDVTIVDVNEQGRRAFYITNGLVSGFTIRRGGWVGQGGGVYLAGSGVVENCRIENCFAARGGGLFFNGGGVARNCLIISNMSEYFGGGVFFNEGGLLENCTVVANSNFYASGCGGGLYATNGGEVVNSIIQFNRSGTGSNYYHVGSGWSYTHTCTTPPVPGDGNLASDPKFRAFPTNLRLRASSPCVNAGTNRAWMAAAQDLDGRARILDQRVDLGAYERDPAELDEVTLAIVSPHGAPTPPAGIYTNGVGTALTNSVSSVEEQGRTRYLCTGWFMPENDPVSGATNALTMIHTNHATLTWTWKAQYLFEPAAHPGGSVLGDAPGWYDAGSSVTVTAAPDAHFVFFAWAGDVPSGQETQNPLTLILDQPRAVTAQFANVGRTLTIQCAHGTCSPPAGVHTNDLGVVLTNLLLGAASGEGTQYVCTGWILAGHDPTAGTTTSFVMTVTNDAVLTWTWITQVWFETSADPNGRVAGSSNGWYLWGSPVSVAAIPDAGYHFRAWQGDAPAGQSNLPDLSFALEARCSLTATFALAQPHACALTTGGVATVWDADPGRLYRLQGCSNLNQPIWFDVGGVVTAAADAVFLTDPDPAAPWRFYRVLQLGP